MVKYKLIWRGEVIETNLNKATARYLLQEYNLAYDGGVTMVKE